MKDISSSPRTVALAVFGPIPLDFGSMPVKSASASAKVVRDAFARKYPKHDWTVKEGCYVFALQNQSAPVPYYAGQANSPLCKESVSSDKLLKYLHAADKHKGTPVLFFVAAASPTKNDLDQKVLDHLEIELIRLTVRANPRALNVHEALGKRQPYFVKGIAELSYSPKIGKADASSKLFASMYFES